MTFRGVAAMNFFIIVYTLVFALSATCYAQTLPTTLRLIGREEALVHHDIFTDTEWRWLGNKKDLIVGTAYPDYPPFEMTASGLGFEGVTPDVVGVLSRLMGVNVIVRRYESYEAAKTALSSGQIDVLGTTTLETLDDRFILTSPYVSDKPVIISRVGAEQLVTSARRLAVIKDYRSIATLQRAFPTSQMLVVNTFADGAAAVAYGQADLLVGDLMSANYLINKSYVNELRILPASQLQTQGYAFALASSNHQLSAILNKGIASLSQQVRDSIYSRWSGGLPTGDAQTIQWDSSELEWKKAHNNVVPISVNGLLAPIAYYDTEGNFRGMASDILNIVHLKTGLRFVPVRADSISEMVKQVRDEKVMAAAAVTRYGFGKEVLSFTVPYFSDGLVLIAGKNDRLITGLDAMGKKPLAIIRGTDLTQRLLQLAPGLNIVEVDNSTLALEQLLAGKIDGLLQSQAVSTYYVNRFFADQLRIVRGVDGQSVNFSIAVSKSEPELLSILNKALLSIPPQELSVLANRWSGPPEASTSSWESVRGAIMRISAMAATALIVGGLWIAYLRRQIRLRSEAEQELNHQLLLLKTLLDGTPHPIYAVDAGGHLLLYNSAYAFFFGIANTLPGQCSLRQAATNNHQAVARFEELAAEVLSKDHWVKGEIEVQGQIDILHFNHWLLPFYDARNQVAGAIGGWMDVSQQKGLMVDLKAQKELADHASRSKSDFLTTMSHEIRTPLNVVIGMLELALGEKNSLIINRSYIEVAYDSSRSLLGILGDILDLAKIESGRLELCREPVDLHSVLQEVVLAFQGLARQKKLTLVLEFITQLDVDIQLDALRMRQVLSNLIGNAIKFTDHGGVTVHAWLNRQERDWAILTITIGDSGTGISKVDQQKLFIPFSQVPGQQRDQRGTGLGLSICKSLMHLMGGELNVTSVLGVGTQVHLSLRVQTLTRKRLLESKPQAAASVQPLSILIVDDHPPNRLLLSQQLKMLGHRTVEAENGSHALEMLESQSFDLMITDCNMPKMSGYSLTREVRERAGYFKQLVIYGHTADAQPQVTQLCMEAGMDGCFFKPTGLSELSQVIASMFKLRQERDQGVINVESILKLCGGQPALANQLIEELIKTNSQDAIELQEAIASTQFSLANEIVHRIKSASKIVSANKLTAVCLRYEACVSNCQDSSELITLASDIQEQLTLLDSTLITLFPNRDIIEPRMH